LPAWFVGVRCSEKDLIERRRETGWDSGRTEGEVLELVRAWDREVHRPGIYDLEVDTSVLDPQACARHLLDALRSGSEPSVFAQLFMA